MSIEFQYKNCDIKYMNYNNINNNIYNKTQKIYNIKIQIFHY